MKGGRIIALTGASRGLGLALARELIRRGHVVEGASRSGRHSDGGEEFPLAAIDVSNPADLRRWGSDLLARGHCPDIVVCNAALINAPAPLWEVPEDELRDIIATNVLGTMYTLQALLPPMLERGHGILVLVSSGWGRGVDPDVVPYCTSKWAVEGLGLSLAQELPEGFAAVTLNPGVVQTEMLHTCWPEQASAYELPESWAKRAAELILSLSDRDNGRQVTVPRS